MLEKTPPNKTSLSILFFFKNYPVLVSLARQTFLVLTVFTCLSTKIESRNYLTESERDTELRFSVPIVQQLPFCFRPKRIGASLANSRQLASCASCVKNVRKTLLRLREEKDRKPHWDGQAPSAAALVLSRGLEWVELEDVVIGGCAEVERLRRCRSSVVTRALQSQRTLKVQQLAHEVEVGRDV